MSKQFFKKCGQYLFSLILFLFVLLVLGFLVVDHYLPWFSVNQIVFHVLYLDWTQIVAYKLPIILTLLAAALLTFLLQKWPIIFVPILAVAVYHIHENLPKVSHIDEDKQVSLLKQITLSLSNTDIYEKYYVAPRLFEHIEKPKNMVVIFAESIESTFADADYWGENLIPNLSALADKHTAVKGYQSINGTNWTIAAHVATFCGVPLRMQLRDVLGVDTPAFMPNITCLPDVLQQAGYHTLFLKGAYLSFAGTETFVTEHRFSETIGRDELLALGAATEDDIKHSSFGIDFGINDVPMFAFARQKLSELSRQKQPFFVSIQTLDTHFPDGYTQPFCAKKYGDIRDAVKCSDAQIADFVKWIQQQDFYENTVVLVLGDHLMMNTADIGALLEKQPRREAYNMIMQKGDAPRVIQNNFAQFDWGATILDLLGVSDTPQLGLGRSLLRNEPTLTEQLGAQKFEEELLKNSHQYRYFLGLTNQ